MRLTEGDKTEKTWGYEKGEKFNTLFRRGNAFN